MEYNLRKRRTWGTNVCVSVYGALFLHIGISVPVSSCSCSPSYNSVLQLPTLSPQHLLSLSIYLTDHPPLTRLPSILLSYTSRHSPSAVCCKVSPRWSSVPPEGRPWTTATAAPSGLCRGTSGQPRVLGPKPWCTALPGNVLVHRLLYDWAEDCGFVDMCLVLSKSDYSSLCVLRILRIVEGLATCHIYHNFFSTVLLPTPLHCMTIYIYTRHEVWMSEMETCNFWAS